MLREMYIEKNCLCRKKKIVIPTLISHFRYTLLVSFAFRIA